MSEPILTNEGLVATNPNAIWTFTGRMVEPLNPDPDSIAIEDIAHAISRQCRFTGHTSEFYSVAQHSVCTADLVLEEHGIDRLDLVMYALLHDGTEAYLSDVARPLKHHNEFGDLYREIEQELMDAIAFKFGLPPGPMPDAVKQADDVALKIEIRDLMPEQLRVLYADAAAFAKHPKPLRPLGPREAEAEYLRLYHAVRNATT